MKVFDGFCREKVRASVGWERRCLVMRLLCVLRSKFKF